MKKVLGLCVLALALIGFGTLAVCGPFHPYFGVENIGLVTAPEFICGVAFEDTGGPWSLNCDGSYTNPNLLDRGSPWIFDFAVTLGWGHVATIDQTGSLKYGCRFTFDQSIELAPAKLPEEIEKIAQTTGLAAEGYVGPLTAWIGCDFPWLGGKWLDLIPSLGFLVYW